MTTEEKLKIARNALVEIQVKASDYTQGLTNRLNGIGGIANKALQRIGGGDAEVEYNDLSPSLESKGGREGTGMRDAPPETIPSSEEVFNMLESDAPSDETPNEGDLVWYKGTKNIYAVQLAGEWYKLGGMADVDRPVRPNEVMVTDDGRVRIVRKDGE